MNTPSSPLPIGWETLLNEIQDRLQQAIETMSSVPVLSIDEAVPPLALDPTPLEELMQRLQEQAATAGASLLEIDQSLAATETVLREHQVNHESVRHRLAGWVYRAIR